MAEVETEDEILLRTFNTLYRNGLVPPEKMTEVQKVLTVKMGGLKQYFKDNIQFTNEIVASTAYCVALSLTRGKFAGNVVVPMLSVVRIDDLDLMRNRLANPVKYEADIVKMLNNKRNQQVYRFLDKRSAKPLTLEDEKALRKNFAGFVAGLDFSVVNFSPAEGLQSPVSSYPRRPGDKLQFSSLREIERVFNKFTVKEVLATGLELK